MKRNGSYVRMGARNVLSVLLTFALVLAGMPIQALAYALDDEGAAPITDEQSLQEEVTPEQEPDLQIDEEQQPQDDQAADVSSDDTDPEPSTAIDEAPDAQPADPDTTAADESATRHEGHLRLIQNGENPYATSETDPLTVAPVIEGKVTEAQYQALKKAFTREITNFSEDGVDVSQYHLTGDEVGELVENVINLNPDFWYVSSGFHYYVAEDGTVTDLCFHYVADKATVTKLQSKYRAALDDALSWVPQDASTAEKVKAAHDWLVRNVAYNEEAADTGSSSYPRPVDNDPWSAYGALVAKSAVCQGYSLAFSAILGALGIETCYAHSFDYRMNVGHVWNRVKVDGSWYHVDVTWDDPVPDAGFDRIPASVYFLRSDRGLRSIGDSTHQSWDPTKPACTSTKYDNKSDWPTYKEPAENKVKVTSFDLSSSTMALGMYDSAKLEIINKSPANATTYGTVWTTSDDSVVFVDSTGEVYAHDIPGTATITCTVDGVSRSCEVTVAITPDDFDIWWPDNFDIYSPKFEYKGYPWEPKPNVSLGDKKLVLGTDYTISYRNNLNVGTATAIITGKGVYTGSKEIPFEITPLIIGEYGYNYCDVQLSRSIYPYTGKPVEPKPVVVFDGSYEYGTEPFELVEGKDYVLSYRNNVECGGGQVIVTGINNCAGEFEIWFWIEDIEITDVADISIADVAPIADEIYDGNERRPKLVITSGSMRLEEGIDYTLSYANNVDPGTATVTIKGIGEFKGSMKTTFKIKVDAAQLTVAKVNNKTYTGKAIKPKPEVTFNGEALVSGTDFTYSYKNNVNAGTATITVKGTGDSFTGSKSVTFNIVPASIANATAEKIADATYTGSAITPAPVVSFASATLAAGKDYDVAYKDNVNAGTATATLTGKGNFKGTKLVEFTIVPADLSKATVASVADQRHTGSAVKPTPQVELGSTVLKLGTDYTLSYKNNVNIGLATIMVTGRGNYKGTKTAKFNIVEVATLEMYRLYNPNSGEHFYTASAVERDALVKRGWKYEGIGWVAPEVSGTPVYRLYNAYAGDHHYTTNEKERDALVGRSWKYEGIGWYSDDAQGVPLYRQYNPNAATGSHNYTTSKAENDALVRLGWKAEGIGWYGVK